MKNSVLRILSFITFVTLESTSFAFCLSKERRETVKYMENMATIEWAPAEDVKYWNSIHGTVYRKGATYKGIPYTQNERWTSLGRFIINCKQEGKKYVYIGECKNGKYLGNDCSWAVSTAWREIADPMFNLTYTGDMFKAVILKKGELVAVGDYKFTGTETSSKDVTDANGEEKMFKAYSALKPGDAVLTHTKNTGTGTHSGHIRLVVAVDPENKKITVIDQVGVDDNHILIGQNHQSSWRYYEELTFDELYSKGYIPVGNAKLLESDVNEENTELENKNSKK